MKTETFEPGSNQVLKIEGRVTSILKKVAKVELFREWKRCWNDLGGTLQFILVLGMGMLLLGTVGFPFINWLMEK